MVSRILARLMLAVAALTAVAAPAAEPGPAPAHPALWVVRDADTTIYLFGTVHVLKPGLDWYRGPIAHAMDASGTLVLEIVSPTPTEMQGLIMAHGIEPQGTTLPDQLPADKRQALADALAGLGMPADAFDHLQPWLAATTLSLLPLQKAGYDATQGPETVLAVAAKATGKPVEGLETAEQQVNYLATLPAAVQADFLVSTLKDLPHATADIDEMVADWAAGEPDKLARLMNDDIRDTPEVARVLLTERNARWARWVEARLKTPGTVFVAVGAGHLAGGDSVQADLARDGVKVERVPG